MHSDLPGESLFRDDTHPLACDYGTIVQLSEQMGGSFFDRDDYLWSYIVMKQVRIAELKAKLSEFLRAVQGGESFAVLDRNTAIAQIVPLRERPGIRIRKPASGSPTPNKVPLPKLTHLKVDVLDALLEERQSNR
jgi:antitoxin (DNA-binding transcriptional repressor) of toxin-antitoxin stability system